MHSYTEKDKTFVWNKATIVQGYNSSQYRKDRCGAWIEWSSFGNRNSSLGWEIDHIIPISKGGQNHVNNVQPLHWKNNVSKGDGSLVCVIFG